MCVFKKKKSAREQQQQHCWDSVGQKITQKQQRFIYKFKKKRNLINMSYCGTFRKGKKEIKTPKLEHEASPVKPLMELMEL